jgi:predicted esterase/lysophospholipase L1-like esterase
MNHLSRTAVCIPSCLTLTSAAWSAGLYVAPTGNDANPGTRSTPFQSLAAARDAARRLAGKEPVTVTVADGVYYLPETLAFIPADSGSEKNPAIYQALNEGKAIISGGLKLDLKWESQANGTFKALTPAGLSIDQLFIDGQRQRMARYPNFDPNKPTAAYQGYSADAFSKERAAKWADPAGGYIHAMQVHRWGGYHYRITGKNPDGGVAYEGGWQNNRQMGMHPEFRMVENIFEELDAPGEWFHNAQTRTLYFKPEPAMDLAKANVEVVRLRHLVEFKGTSKQAVKHITLKGFTYRATPISPPSSLCRGYDRQAGPTQWLFQGPPAESKFLAVIRKSASVLAAIVCAAGMIRAEDLPKVLIIGDSISIGYTEKVKQLLAGKAEVSRPPENCRFSGYGLENVAKWIGNGKWDVVHFNFGIWDVHLLDKGEIVMPSLADRDPALFKRRSTTKEYVANLKGMLRIIKPAAGKVIFATTTPFTTYGEGTKALISANNKAARDQMEAQGVRINDLHALALPNLATWHDADGVHFNEEGYRHLAVATALSIADTLGIQLDGAAKDQSSLQPRKVSEGTAFGRTLQTYEHASLGSWGYGKAQNDTFRLLLPGRSTDAPPLCVVLHSAGGDGNELFRPICAPHAERGFYGDETFHVLSLDCAKNRNDWWWGAEEISRNPDRYRNELSPTEKRVMATIEWVVGRFGVDRNRIYLNGISMGGSGTLGLGLSHGDVFAAAAVIVPAGIPHVRTRLFDRKVPDLPPLLNLLSHRDEYSKGQEELMAYLRENRYAAAFAWVPWGHDAHRIGLENPFSVYDYPWLSIRRNEAYPVFTGATSDNRYPGFKDETSPDQSGQSNLWFRWDNRVDDWNRFSMALWIAPPDEAGERTATADITLRRLQRFAVVPGRQYRWSLTEGGKLVQQGRVTNNNGLLTMPDVRLTRTPAVLTLE